ncbi:AAA family ATPase [Patescibacteria group bacterium]|nr:AAA family ATPase [Patescibacteria group bacterium]
MNKIIALVGMTGAGKSLVADYLVNNGWGFSRFGQIVLDIVKERGLEPKEEAEKPIREELRREHGMAAMALLNIPKFDKILEENNLVADGLYSWSEYKVLKDYYQDRLSIIAVYAPPRMRYERLEKRQLMAEDKDLRHRPATKEQAKSRDFAEIENIEKGGPIAMADYTLLNISSKENLFVQIENILAEINSND